MGSPFIFAITPNPPFPRKKRKENKAVRHPQGSASRQLSKVFLIKSCSEAEGEERERERGGGGGLFSGVRTGSLSLDCSLPDTLIC